VGVSGTYLDVDTTDAFLDVAEPRYAGGQTIWERLEAQGYDVTPAGLGTLSAQIAERRGVDQTLALPAPIDH
jgi:hypothetical protein